MNLCTRVENVREIPDPRRPYGHLQHRLENIVVIAFCATLCGAQDFEDIEECGKARKPWLETFLDLKNGIPDKDTFRRVFERLDPAGLAKCLYAWLDRRDCAGKTMNIDGKTIRGSRNAQHKAYHVLCAWGGAKTTSPSARWSWTGKATRPPPSPRFWTCWTSKAPS
jgi:hypothetical protein